MNPNNFPQNGLPKELASIPYGEIFILINPYLGIQSKDVYNMQFIFSMAKQFGQKHIVNALPIEYSGLWNCFACKVQTGNGNEVLVADKDSLVEMLCEFWGLNYEEVCKNIQIAGRNKTVTCGVESHPIRAIVPTRGIEPSLKEPDFGISLGCWTAHTREGALGDIRSTLRDNASYGLGISLDELIAIYNEIESSKKTYTLDIHVEKKEVFEKGKPVQKIKSCDISLIDNEGNKYPLKMSAYSKALYLTFILFKNGIAIKDIPGEEKFLKRFRKIYSQLPYRESIPSKFDFGTDYQYMLFLQKVGKIRDAIMDVTNDNYVKERFAVEGKKGEPFGVAGATAEHREIIKKEFGMVK